MTKSPKTSRFERPRTRARRQLTYNRAKATRHGSKLKKFKRRQNHGGPSGDNSGKQCRLDESLREEKSMPQ